MTAIEYLEGEGDMFDKFSELLSDFEILLRHGANIEEEIMCLKDTEETLIKMVNRQSLKLCEYEAEIEMLKKQLEALDKQEVK